MKFRRSYKKKMVYIHPWIDFKSAHTLTRCLLALFLPSALQPLNFFLLFLSSSPSSPPPIGYQPDSSQSSTLTLLPSSSLDLKAVSAVACDLLLAASELSLMKTVLASLQSFHITLPADGDGASAKPISIHDVWKVCLLPDVISNI